LKRERAKVSAEPFEAGPDEEPAVKRILTPEEFQKLLPFIPEPYRTMVLVGACLGLRVSEILGLQWGDILWERLEINIRRAVVLGTVDKVKTPKSKSVMPLDPDPLPCCSNTKGTRRHMLIPSNGFSRIRPVENHGDLHIFSRNGSVPPAFR
jgi:integrase